MLSQLQWQANHLLKVIIQYLSILNAPFKDPIPFRIAETPVFIDKKFRIKIILNKLNDWYTDNMNDIEINRWVINVDSHHKTRKLLKEFMFKFN